MFVFGNMCKKRGKLVQVPSIEIEANSKSKWGKSKMFLVSEFRALSDPFPSGEREKSVTLFRRTEIQSLATEICSIYMNMKNDTFF